MFTFLRRSRKPSPLAASLVLEHATVHHKGRSRCRKQRTAVRPSLESLEPRTLLSLSPGDIIAARANYAYSGLDPIIGPYYAGDAQVVSISPASGATTVLRSVPFSRSPALGPEAASALAAGPGGHVAVLDPLGQARGLYDLDPASGSLRLLLADVSGSSGDLLTGALTAAPSGDIIAARTNYAYSGLDPIIGPYYAGDAQVVSISPASGATTVLRSVPFSRSPALGPEAASALAAGPGGHVAVLDPLGQARGLYDLDPASGSLRLLLADVSGSSGDLLTGALTVVPAAPFNLSVTTPYSREKAGPVFGPYLPGATLDVPFTVQATDPGHKVQQVKWEISGKGGGSGTASPGGAPGTWTFHFNVQNLDPSPHTLTVTALDASGKQVGKPYTAQVDAEKLSLSLKLTGQVGAGSATDVNDLRFIHSTDPRLAVNETFKGEVVNLPDYYTHSTVVVSLSGARIPVKLESTGGNLGFEFDRNAETLPARTNPVAVKVGADQLAIFGAKPQPLVAVNLPAWLRTGTPSFDPQAEAYRFTDVHLPLVKLNVPLAPIDTGVPWLNAKLNGLQTFADLTATVATTIPLNVKKTPTVEKTGDKLNARAFVLGQLVWQKSYDTSQLVAGGTLDPKTLEANSIYVRLANPIDLGQKVLFDRTGKNAFSATFPVVAPLVSAKATLGVQVIGDLMVNAGIQLGWQNHWVLQSPGTFLTLIATAKAHVEATLDAKVGVGFIEETVQVAKAYLDATLTITGTATFSGSLPLPSIASTTLQGTLAGNYGFEFLADLLDEKDKKDTTVDEKPTLPDFSIQLFKL